jgi:hypothetical protein
MSSECPALQEGHRHELPLEHGSESSQPAPYSVKNQGSTSISKVGVVNDVVNQRTTEPQVLKRINTMRILCLIAESILVMAPGVFIGKSIAFL